MFKCSTPFRHFIYSFRFAFAAQTLNLLFDMRDKLNDEKTMAEVEQANGGIKKWLLLNGMDSIIKFKEFERNGFNKPLTFSRNTLYLYLYSKMFFHFLNYVCVCVIEIGDVTFEAYIDPENAFDAKDKFSQINTLEQLKNVNNYHFLAEKIRSGETLRSYALWTDVFKSEVYLFSYLEKRFVKIDEDSYERLYKECQIDSIA